MIHLKVSLMLGGDPYDQARIDGIETFVRDALADGLMLEYEHVEVTRLPCAENQHVEGSAVWTDGIGRQVRCVNCSVEHFIPWEDGGMGEPEVPSGGFMRS